MGNIAITSRIQETPLETSADAGLGGGGGDGVGGGLDPVAPSNPNITERNQSDPVIDRAHMLRSSSSLTTNPANLNIPQITHDIPRPSFNSTDRDIFFQADLDGGDGWDDRDGVDGVRGGDGNSTQGGMAVLSLNGIDFEENPVHISRSFTEYERLSIRIPNDPPNDDEPSQHSVDQSHSQFSRHCGCDWSTLCSWFYRN
jgi:hypothetical protein